MTAALQEPHWLPAAQRIHLKSLTLMHGAVHANSPRYLGNHVTTYVPCRNLRSADQAFAVVPGINRERFRRQGISCAGPSLWNTPPFLLKLQCVSEHFRTDLKTI